jgi:Sec-independent protein translocase protein TatA
MFGLGFSEIFIIFLGILLFINPEQYPNYYKKFMAFYSQLTQFKRGFERELNSLDALSQESSESQETSSSKKDPETQPAPIPFSSQTPTDPE